MECFRCHITCIAVCLSEDTMMNLAHRFGPTTNYIICNRCGNYLNTTLSKERSTHQKIETSLKEENQRLKDRIAELESSRISDITRENEDLKSQVEKLNHELNRIKVDRSQEHHLMNQYIHRIQIDKDELLEERDILKMKELEHSQQIQKLRSALDTIKKEFEIYQETLKSKDATISHLESEIEDFSRRPSENEELSHKYQHLKDEFKITTEKCNLLEFENDTLTKEIGVVKDERDDLLLQIEESKDSIERLQGLIMTLKIEKSQMKNKLKTIQEKLEESTKEVEKYKSQAFSQILKRY